MVEATTRLLAIILPGLQISDRQINSAMRFSEHKIGARAESIHLQDEKVRSYTASMLSPFDPEAEEDPLVERAPRTHVFGVILQLSAKAATRLPQARFFDRIEPFHGAVRLVSPFVGVTTSMPIMLVIEIVN